MTSLSKSPFYKNLAYILICIVAIGHIIYVGKELLSPLMFSFLFSILLLPASYFLERKLRFPRFLSSMVPVLFLLSFIVFIFYFLGMQASSFSEDVPHLRTQIAGTIHDFQVWLEAHFNIQVKKQDTYINDALSTVLSASTTVLGITFLSLSSVLIFLVFTHIYTFFLLFFRRHLVNFLLNVFDKAHKPIILEIIGQVRYMVKSYIVGLFFELCIVTGLTFGLLFIIGAKYALLLGMIAGVLNLIPYVGIFTCLAIAFVITFATAGVGKALVVALCIFIIHLLDSNVIMPKIVGEKVKINAMMAILGVVMGSMMWGIAGMFLSIPVIAIFKIIFDRIDMFKPWGALLGGEKKPLLEQGKE